MNVAFRSDAGDESEPPIAIQAGVDGTAVTVSSPHRPVVSWVERCMDRWWSTTAVGDSSGRPAVHSRVDPEAVERIADVVRADPEPVSLYLAASGLRRRVGDNVLAWSPQRRLAYEYDRARHRVRLVGDTLADVRKETARIVRVLVTDQLEADGWTVMHAACVTGPAGATLIPGVKGAGKTTASILAAQLPDRRLLAHDLCLVRASSDTIRVLAVPTPLRIGMGLVDALGWGPTLTRALREGTSLHPFLDEQVAAALREGRYERLDSRDRELKLELFPRELTALFNVGTVSSADVSAVLMPQPATGDSALSDPLTELASHVIWGPTTGYPNFLDLPAPPPPAERRQTREVLERLAALPRRTVAFEFDIDRDRASLAAALRGLDQPTGLQAVRHGS
ncbi:hypothetical protein [Micromonospora sediminicola]|uniref:hypothetical protein n=1 Tax=Micromonospora sediminicola TaxID=946078 RepID=UPI003799D4B9